MDKSALPVHPGILNAVTDGIRNLFGTPTAVPEFASAKPPGAAPMDDGGVVRHVARPASDEQVHAAVTAEIHRAATAKHPENSPSPAKKVGTYVQQGNPGGALGNAVTTLQEHAQNPYDAGGAVAGADVPMAAPAPSMLPQQAIPGRGGAVLAGIAAGANLADNYQQGERLKLEQAQRQAEFGRTEAAKSAAADAIPQDELGPAVDDFAQHLHDHSLNDAGAAHNSQALPSTAAGPDGQPTSPAAAATAGALAQASGPAGQTPQQSPASSGKPHSLGPEFWDANQRKIMSAVAAATRAGKDPAAVYEHLNAVRNGFFQSNVLKNLSAANIALQNGDSDAVAKAMKNVYYYFPDGKELDVKRDADGTVIYQDPITPYIDQNGDPTSAPSFHGKANKPNMVPITPQHLQLLATAALDPMKVGDIIAGTRAAAAKQQLEFAQAEGARMTGLGRYQTSLARMKEAQNRGELIPSEKYNNLTKGDLNRARAAHLGWVDDQIKLGGGNQKLDPQVEKGAHDAAAAVNQMAVGVETVEPDTVQQGTDKKGNPVMVPNQRAGQKTMDTSRVHPALKGVNAETLAGIQAEAGNIFIANAHDGMSAHDAAQLATQAYQAKHQTHDEGGKKVPNYLINRKEGYGKVWIPGAAGQPGRYRMFRLTAHGADLALSGGQAPSFAEMSATQMALAGDGEGGGGAIPTPGPEEGEGEEAG